MVKQEESKLRSGDKKVKTFNTTSLRDYSFTNVTTGNRGNASPPSKDVNISSVPTVRANDSPANIDINIDNVDNNNNNNNNSGLLSSSTKSSTQLLPPHRNNNHHVMDDGNPSFNASDKKSDDGLSPSSLSSSAEGKKEKFNRPGFVHSDADFPPLPPSTSIKTPASPSNAKPLKRIKIDNIDYPERFFPNFPPKFGRSGNIVDAIVSSSRKRKKSGNTVNNSITILVLHKNNSDTSKRCCNSPMIRCVNPLATVGNHREPARIVQVIAAGVIITSLTQQ